MTDTSTFVARIENDGRSPALAPGESIEARNELYADLRHDDKQADRDQLATNDIEARLALWRRVDREDLLPASTVREWVALDARDMKDLRGVVREESAIRVHENAARNPVYHETLHSRYADLAAEANGAYSMFEKQIIDKESRKERDMELIDKETRKGNDMELSASISPIGASLDLKTGNTDGAAGGAQNQEREVRIEDNREMDRARLEAFFNQQRHDALRQFPDLHNAYALRDASQAFAKERIVDPTAQKQFAAMTDKFIEDKLGRGEQIPDLKQPTRELEVEHDR